jgi:hypothetical protein
MPNLHKLKTESATLLLVLICITIISLVILEGETFISASRYSKPLKWHFFEIGINYVNASGIYMHAGTALRLNNLELENASTSQAFWKIYVSPSLSTYKSIRVNLYISSLPFSNINGSVVTVGFNDYNITLRLDKLTRFPDGSFFYVPKGDVKEEVENVKGSFISLEIPSTYLLPSENQIRIITTPRSEWYIEKLILELEVPQEASSPLTLSPLTTTLLAVTYLIFTVYLLREYLKKPKTIRTAILIGFTTRIFLAPFTEHPYDVEVYKQYIRLFYDHSVLNLGYWIYGPLWLFSMLFSVFPIYLFQVLNNDGILNFVIKIPPIISDLAIFSNLYSYLRGFSDENKALNFSKWGWLYNPMVIYFSSVHGIYSSTVALFILLAYKSKKAWVSAIFLALAVGFLPISVIAFFPLLLKYLSNWRNIICFTLSSSIFSVLTYLMPYTILEDGVIFHRIQSYLTMKDIEPYSWLNLLKEVLVSHPILDFVKNNFLLLYIIMYSSMVVVYLMNYHRKSDQNLPLKFLILLFLLFYFMYPYFYPQHLLWILPVVLLSVPVFKWNKKMLYLIIAMTTIIAIFPLLYDPNVYRVIIVKPFLTDNPNIGELITPGLYAYFYSISVVPSTLFIIYVITLFSQNKLVEKIFGWIVRFFPFLLAFTITVYIFFLLESNLLLFAAKIALMSIFQYVITKKHFLYSVQGLFIQILCFLDVSNTAYLLREAHFAFSWMLLPLIILYILAFFTTLSKQITYTGVE